MSEAVGSGDAIAVVGLSKHLRIALAGLVLVDLPVDVVVVLEQQERAGQGERMARSVRQRKLGLLVGEHMFVE